MIRLLFTLALGAAIYYGGVWLLDHPGQVSIDWLGLEITLHIAVLALALLVVLLVFGYFSVLLWRFVTWPERRRSRKQHRTVKRGLEHLTRGVTALAMGDEAIAEEALKKARAALPNEPLPQLLTAQLLQRQGKHSDAQTHFQALVFHPATTGLATRKLIEQHLQRKEWKEAAALTEEAQKTTPRDPWLTMTRIDLNARAGDTQQMLALTEGWQWQSPLSKEQRHRYAALAYYLAAQKDIPVPKKERELRHALGYAPDFLPAIIAYAQNATEDNHHKAARKALLAAWRENPCMALVQPILDSLVEEPTNTQLRLLKPFLKGELTAAHYLLEAKHALEVGEAMRARPLLEQSIALDSTREGLLLMADIENALHDTHAANTWSTRAANAPAGTTWVCSDCGHLHAEWVPHCDSCGHFDSLRYERPEARVTSVDVTAI